MKTYFCTKCFEQFELEAPGVCPKCGHNEVAEANKENANAVVAKVMDQLLSYQKTFVAQMDNGFAGGSGGKKTIAKFVRNPETKAIEARYESLDAEAEAWADNIKLYINGGMSSVRKEGNKIVSKAPHGMNIGVPGEGGYLTFTSTIQNVIIEGAMQQSIFLSRAFKIPAGSSLIRVPRLQQGLDPSGSLNFFGGVSWSYLNDAGIKLATKPVIEYLQFAPYEHAALLPLSHALIQDASINVVEWVTNLMIRSFAYLIDHDCLVGNGAGKCLGIVNDPNILFELRVAAGEVHLDDFSHMDQRINDVFDPTAEWFLRSSIGKSLRMDTTGGLLPIPRWLEGAGYQAAIGQPFKPALIGGRTPNYTYNTPAVGAWGDVILGPLDQYWLAVRKELTVDESDHFYFDTNEKALRFVARLDGKPAIPQAFVVLSDAQIQP